MNDVTHGPSPTLSFGAEQLLARARRWDGADGGDVLPLYNWVLGLVEHHRSLAVATEVDVADLEDGARRNIDRGDPGERTTRDDVVEWASHHARREGRSVVTPEDVASTILKRAIERLDRPIASDDGSRPELPDAKVERTDLLEASTAPRTMSTSDSVRPVSHDFSSPASRTIRVFVSSTFRDMQDERDELVKRVFPELRKLCERRGVRWSEVDLRWGITDEQAAEGEVLPICLAEIRRCRPFFIGLLGERYGWIPDRIAGELVEKEPWISENRRRSVTELEILHGVLNDPDMADHAFFYFRRRDYVDLLPEDQQNHFRETPRKEEIEELGREQAEQRCAQRKDKLASLKERIKDSPFPVREDYTDPVELGKLVLADLTEVINRLYPEISEPGPLDREIAEHEAYARSRFGVYIGRQEYYERLDAHVEGDEPPLVVLGESGSGKSALLANWARRYRDKDPSARGDDLFLMHFIGATPASADWAAMLLRILGEFKRGLGMEVEIPDQPEQLRATFANALHQAAARGRVVLVLDALNQLEDRDQAPDLVWLPPVIPENLRLIVSTLPGRPLNELSRRRWPVLQVEPLRVEERAKIIDSHLARHAKALSPDRLERIATSPQADNPLFLRAMLDELTLWGEHSTLDVRIDHYLSATGLDELFARILARYEQDYERDRPGLVKEAMSLLWAARRGLAEAELLDLLGDGTDPLPSAHWSPLHLAAERALVSRAGLIGFFHDHLRRAVESRYLSEQRERTMAHLRIADYFEARPSGVRKVEELPWQLASARAWERLSRLLADLDFFEAAWNHDPFEVKAHWATVERDSGHRLVEAYRPYIDAPPDREGALCGLANLLGDTGHLEESSAIWEFVAGRARDRGDRERLAASLGNQAVNANARGEPREALGLHQEEERICRELGDRVGLAASLGDQAVIRYQRGELDEALALHEEEERISRETADLVGFNRSLANQANICLARGLLDDAMRLYRRMERICRELGDKVGLYRSLGNEAVVMSARGHTDEALALHAEEERICRELGDRSGLYRSLGNQGNLRYARGELDRAMALHEKEEQICRELGDKAGLLSSLGCQAPILAARGERERAMALMKQQERLARELGDPSGLAMSLVNQAALLAETDLDSALPLALQAFELVKKHGLGQLSSQIEPILTRLMRRAGQR